MSTILEYLQLARWSPYAVGIGIGILSWISFLILKQPISCSTTFVRTAGMFQKILGARGRNFVNNNSYYQKFKPVIDWQWMLVAGIIVGSAVSAWLSADLNFKLVPELWAQSFGDSVGLRILVSFIGGIILGFGSRWAGGCTSGHGISGTMQLVLSSWVSAICFFIGGIITAQIMFKLIGGQL